MKWALIETQTVGKVAKETVLLTGKKKEVKARFRQEKSQPSRQHSGNRMLFLLRVEKRWPKKDKTAKREKAA